MKIMTTVAAVIAMALPVVAQMKPLDIKPGLWESKRTSGEPGSGIAPETTIERRCVTQVMVASNTAFGEPQERNCKKVSFKSTADLKEIHYQCMADGKHVASYMTTTERKDNGLVEVETIGRDGPVPVKIGNQEFFVGAKWRWIHVACK